MAALVMFYLLLSVVAAIGIAAAASSKGFEKGTWFLYALFFWPVAAAHVIAQPANQEILQQRQISSGRYRECPHCVSVIPKKAEVCRHCGRTSEAAPVSPASPPGRSTTRRPPP